MICYFDNINFVTRIATIDMVLLERGSYASQLQMWEKNEPLNEEQLLTT